MRRNTDWKIHMEIFYLSSIKYIEIQSVFETNEQILRKTTSVNKCSEVNNPQKAKTMKS